MNLIDTHSHLYGPEFDEDREEALARAAGAGVGRLLLPAIDSESHDRLFDLCRLHPQRCVPMIGLHPTSVNDNPRWQEELELVEQLLAAPPEGIPSFCAIGEIGLDFYWSRDFREQQTKAFRRQIELALRYDLPIAVHTRNAWPETVALMREYAGRGLRGVFHAYSDTLETYRELRSLGDFRFGIGGVVTFKKSLLAAIVPEMELDDLVLETDCPYLTPAPHRGERNESAYVRFVCNEVARLKGLRPDEVADATTASAERLFRLNGSSLRTGRHEAPLHSGSRLRDRQPATHTTMKRVRITVVRKVCHRDLIARYENPIEHACDLQEGQVFIAEGWQRPEGLCESAWQTLSPFVMTLAHGGTDLYDGWMKNPASAMLSCNDGFRPVSFLVEALDE